MLQYSNNAPTNLTNSTSSGATSFEVNDAAPFPSLAQGDYTYITVGQEVTKVTAITGNIMTCEALVGAYPSGTPVELRMTAEILDDICAMDEY